jgi:hypothetical protein
VSKLEKGLNELRINEGVILYVEDASTEYTGAGVA